MQDCPCGSCQPLADCCGKFHAGLAFAPTPEALMRSRYSAFYLHLFDYIKNTMLPPAADHFNLEELVASADIIKWQRLEIINAVRQTVEFRAYYAERDNEFMLHEISEFRLVDGKWFYVDGVHR